MHTQPNLRKAWWFLPPANFQEPRPDTEHLVLRFLEKALLPRGHSTHRRRCALQCPASMAERALREYFQKQLFVVNYGMKLMMTAEGLIYSLKHEMGQLLSFHFTLVGSGPVRRGGAFRFTQIISWSS